MLDAISGEDFEMAVIHLDGNVDGEFAVGIAENAPQAVVEIEFLGREVKARALRIPGIGFFIDVRRGTHRGHRVVLRNDCKSDGNPAAGGFPGANGQTFRVYGGRRYRSKAGGGRSEEREVIYRYNWALGDAGRRFCFPHSRSCRRSRRRSDRARSSERCLCRAFRTRR